MARVMEGRAAAFDKLGFNRVALDRLSVFDSVSSMGVLLMMLLMMLSMEEILTSFLWVFG